MNDTAILSDSGRPSVTSPTVRAAPPQPDAPAAAAAPPRPGPSPAEALVGTWDFPPPSGMRGPSISFAVDSARGAVFFGNIVRALSGDVLLDNFKPFRGTLGKDGIARIRVELTQPGAPAVEIAGKVEGDRWTGTSFVWGGDELIGGGRSWVGKREEGRGKRTDP